MPRPISTTQAFLQALEDVEALEAAQEISPEESAALTFYYRAQLALKEREVTGEPLRVSRRPFVLSHAAIATSSVWV